MGTIESIAVFEDHLERAIGAVGVEEERVVTLDTTLGKVPRWIIDKSKRISAYFFLKCLFVGAKCNGVFLLFKRFDKRIVCDRFSASGQPGDENDMSYIFSFGAGYYGKFIFY
ncbi:MAG: hypothetical protein AAB557_05725 [Patescibacteria group bacterium]